MTVRRLTLLAVAGPFLLLVALAIEDPSWFPFQPAHDDFQPTILDAGQWIEAPTGKHGFVTVRGENFVFQDGTPARFWGAQMNTMRKEQVDYAVRRMRRQGINITRLHGLEFLNDRSAKTSFEYSESGWDRLDYLIAKLGENGIYIILDVDYPLNYRFKPGDGIDSVPAEGGPAPYAEFLDDRAAGILQRRMVDVFTHLNPYTKKRYCDDPTLALVEVLNEDSLFWAEVPAALRPLAERKFRAWLNARNRGAAAASATWLPNRELLFARMQAQPDKGAMAREQLRFMLELEERYWTGSRDAMRRAGLKVPVSGTNWQGHGSPTTRIHMLGQSRLDYIDRHGYWDHPQGEGNSKWQIATARFHDLPMIKDVHADQDHLTWLGVENLVTEKAWEQVLGKPLTVSEWNTCLPNRYSLEGTGLMAAYGLLQGWDASLEFGYFSPDFRDSLGNGSFDLFGNPPQILQFPAAAAMWYRRDVKEAEVVAEAVYDSESVLAATEDRKMVPAALIGKVGYRFLHRARKPVARNLAPYWDASRLTARSITGQLSWNGARGVVRIDTPRTQAVIGFLSSAPAALDAVELRSSTGFGAVWVTAMDGIAPVRSARRLLVTAVGPARNSGMEYEQTAEKSRLGALWHLKSAGAAPALLEAVVGELSIRSEKSATLKAWTLDVVGRRLQSVPLAKAPGRITLPLEAAHKTVYYELAVD